MDIFRRKIYDDLLKWKDTSKGRTALLIEGARRVGKSTVAEEFGRKEYKSFILINFVSAKKEIKNLFSDMSDLDYFFFNLQFLTGAKLHPRQSLIIFDEVQLFPPAREAIKQLVKDGRYDYIETGSLISIRKNVKNILIPSEEKKIEMNPMDFEEFLWATGRENTAEQLKTMASVRKPVGEVILREAMRLLRLYMVIGGMPQAVETYLETNNLMEVDEVKRAIISLYEDDFYKIDPTGTLSLLFDNIPGELSTDSTRYNISRIIPSSRPSDNNILTNIAELADSRTVNVSYHSNNPTVGLSLTKDLRKFKLYLADTGLFITLAFKDKAFTDNLIYRGLMTDKLPVNLGYVYENMVAQMLRANGDNLFYHTFYKDGSTHPYEVDFLISRDNKLCPIEVKSSSNATHTSLDMFYEKYSSRIKTRYLLYTKDVKKEKDIVCLPLFLVPFI